MTSSGFPSRREEVAEGHCRLRGVTETDGDLGPSYDCITTFSRRRSRHAEAYNAGDMRRPVPRARNESTEWSQVQSRRCDQNADALWPVDLVGAQCEVCGPPGSSLHGDSLRRLRRVDQRSRPALGGDPGNHLDWIERPHFVVGGHDFFDHPIHLEYRKQLYQCQQWLHPRHRTCPTSSCIGFDEDASIARSFSLLDPARLATPSTTCGLRHARSPWEHRGLPKEARLLP